MVKDILGQCALDLTPVLHLPSGLPVRPLNVDLSTVSAATDVAFGFGEPLEQIVDIDLQSGADALLDRRLLLYNTLYHYHNSVPVRTIVILLRRAADHPCLTGKLGYRAGPCRVEFEYEVVRMWQQPLDVFLKGGLGLLPFAPLCQMPEDVAFEEALKRVIYQIDERLAKEAPYARAANLMTGTFLLTGMRVGKERLNEIFQGAKIMHESSAFDVYEEKGLQKGLQKGRQEGFQQARQGACAELQQILLRMGTKRFGLVDPKSHAAILAIDDLGKVERLVEAVLVAESWTELLTSA